MFSTHVFHPFAAMLLATGSGLVWAPGVLGGGIVTEATEPALRSALAGGGTVTLAFSGKVVLSLPLVVTNATVIDGTGQQATISGGGLVRVFEVRPGVSLTLKGITVADGKAQGEAAALGTAGGPGQGSGVFNNGGNLTVANCTFTNNLAVGGNGGKGDAVTSGGRGGSGEGGAIWSDGGTVTLTHCDFTMNSAVGGTGGNSVWTPGPAGGYGRGGAVCALGGTLAVSNCHFGGNLATGGLGSQSVFSAAGDGGDAAGGAIYHSADEFGLTSCVLMDNEAVGGGDGIAPASARGGVGRGLGGGVYSDGSNSRLVGSQFEGNQARWPVTTTFGFYGSAAEAGGGAVFHANGRMEVTECSFINNAVAGGITPYTDSGKRGTVYGGAICNRAALQLSRCEFRYNRASGGGSRRDKAANAFGGAIFNEASAVIQGSQLSFNLATGGYAIDSPGVSGSGFGGAIWNTNSIVVNECTFTTNGAFSPGTTNIEPAQPAFGGAIGNQGSLLATNNTLVGNVAGGATAGSPDGDGGDAFGGAIYNLGGHVTLVHQTFAGNGARGGRGLRQGIEHGGAIFNTNGVVTLRGVIVAASTAGANVEGPIADGGNNLSSDATPVFVDPSSRNSLDPRLGPLDDYGGPTLTMPLLAGSPAIDAGSSEFCPPTDQRGVTRPYGVGCDVGAFESAPPYSIRGRFLGYRHTGGQSILLNGEPHAVATDGTYRLDGLASGIYSIGPSAAETVFVPSQFTITVGPDAPGVDFKGYQVNGLAIEEDAGGYRLVYAGSPGRTVRWLEAPGFEGWQSVWTNTIDPTGLAVWTVTNTSLAGPQFFRAASP